MLVFAQKLYSELEFSNTQKILDGSKVSGQTAKNSGSGWDSKGRPPAPLAKRCQLSIIPRVDDLLFSPGDCKDNRFTRDSSNWPTQ